MSGMLPGTDELSLYREQMADYLDESPDTASIVRRTRVKDTTGGYKQTETTVAAGIPILVYRPSANQNRTEEYTTDAGRLSAAQIWEALLPASTTVQRTDRIDVAGGRSFEVIETNDGETFGTARVLTLTPA